MKLFAPVLILCLVFISFHQGESKWWHVCKDDKPPGSPSPCKQPECNQFCSHLHPKRTAWGSCDRKTCSCLYLCKRSTYDLSEDAGRTSDKNPLNNP